MNNLSIVIPSRNASNLSACVSAIWRHEPEAYTFRIIVIDDGVDWSEFHPAGQGNPNKSVQVVRGVKPFVFAHACNQGIRAAERDDVILLNDDAILETPRGFSQLRDQQYRHPKYGVLGPVIPDCGNIAQRPWLDYVFHDREDIRAAVVAGHIPHPDGSPLRSVRMVIFACAFIPRQTIDRVGLLDECYGVNAGGGIGDSPVGYGCEDGDYCYRVRALGLKVGVYEPVRVEHGHSRTGLRHTFRINQDAARYAGDSRLHEQLYESKWGEKP
jgi:GT2 family glycosyltransferase